MERPKRSRAVRYALRPDRVAQGAEVHGLAQKQGTVDIPQHGAELLVIVHRATVSNP
jgi:hypothetical protein